MKHPEWLRKVLQSGLNEISPSVHSVLSHFETLDEEALWTVLVVLSGCFNDLAKAGDIPSLPPRWELLEVARTFMHLSNTMVTAHKLLRGAGNTPMVLPESDPLIPKGVL